MRARTFQRFNSLPVFISTIMVAQFFRVGPALTHPSAAETVRLIIGDIPGVHEQQSAQNSCSIFDL